MTRALAWSLVGSAAAVSFIGSFIAVLSWADPPMRLNRSTEAMFTILGHDISIGLGVSPRRPSLPVDVPVTVSAVRDADAIFAAGTARLHCVIVP